MNVFSASDNKTFAILEFDLEKFNRKNCKQKITTLETACHDVNVKNIITQSMRHEVLKMRCDRMVAVS